MIGKDLSPVLNEIEEALWDFEFNKPGIQPKYTQDGIKGAIKIFSSVMLDKMWDYQEKNKTSQKKREQLAKEAGEAIRALFKKYTNIDSHNLYK